MSDGNDVETKLQTLGLPTGEAALVRRALGQVINEVAIEGEDSLLLTLRNGTRLQFLDTGQSCCEYRYMTADGDDLSAHASERLVSVELRNAPSIDDHDGDSHDVQFLVIQTDKGQIVIAMHNEHNGYYGGFSLRVCADNVGE